jgi:hypothetical protein
VHTLSKGNMQKIGLILAFAHRPELLVLDEPPPGSTRCCRTSSPAWSAKPSATGAPSSCRHTTSTRSNASSTGWPSSKRAASSSPTPSSTCAPVPPRPSNSGSRTLSNPLRSGSWMGCGCCRRTSPGCGCR